MTNEINYFISAIFKYLQIILTDDILEKVMTKYFSNGLLLPSGLSNVMFSEIFSEHSR